MKGKEAASAARRELEKAREEISKLAAEADRLRGEVKVAQDNERDAKRALHSDAQSLAAELHDDELVRGRKTLNKDRQIMIDDIRDRIQEIYLYLAKGDAWDKGLETIASRVIGERASKLLSEETMEMLGITLRGGRAARRTKLAHQRSIVERVTRKNDDRRFATESL